MFFPLKDHNPTERFPFVTIGLIAINIAVFVYEMMLGENLSGFITSYGAIPYEISQMTDLSGRYVGSPIYHTDGPPLIPLTLFTSMFMHGGVMHIAGNMLYLWIFGNNVEDILGPVKFLLFYLGCGLIASLAHIYSDPQSTIPTVGASGAVAGVLGAYLIAYPRARVLTLIFLGIFIRMMEVPAAVVLIVWFALQFFQGVFSLAGGHSGGIAWWAHIGGFVAGIIAVTLLAPRTIHRLRQERRAQRARR